MSYYLLNAPDILADKIGKFVASRWDGLQKAIEIDDVTTFEGLVQDLPIVSEQAFAAELLKGGNKRRREVKKQAVSAEKYCAELQTASARHLQALLSRLNFKKGINFKKGTFMAK